MKINFKTVHTSKCSQEQYNTWRSQDEKAIGTPKYQGLAYFHNYEYRHLLRDWSDFEELAHRKSFRLISNWNDPKAWPNKNDYGSIDNERLQYAEKNWHILYKAIHDSFVKEGLKTDGFSVSHTKIIAQTLHINEKALIDVYHGQVKENLNMPNPLTIYFYSDPGHGWGGVPRDILTLLEIESYISACSYQVGDMVWLEEDCDLSVLCMALINQNIEFKFTDIPTFFGNQDIRTCKHYKPE